MKTECRFTLDTQNVRLCNDNGLVCVPQLHASCAHVVLKCWLVLHFMHVCRTGRLGVRLSYNPATHPAHTV